MSEAAPVTTEKKIRAFIALNPPPEIIEPLAQLQRALQAAIRSHFVKWTQPAQIHLTLKFLGHVPEDSVVRLEEVLRPVCAEMTAFEVRLEGLGFFPGSRNPRILWVGLHDRGDSLRVLQSNVENATREFSAHEDKREFHPHLTLARVKDVDRAMAAKLAAATERLSSKEFGVWRVETVELMRSVLSPQGSSYERLASFALKMESE